MAIYINKEKAQFYLSTPPNEKWFYLKNGEILRNIYELKEFFSNCSEEVYKEYKTDFYNWVVGVFQNDRLAMGLKSSRTSKEAILYTDRNIKMLERNANRL